MNKYHESAKEDGHALLGLFMMFAWNFFSIYLSGIILQYMQSVPIGAVSYFVILLAPFIFTETDQTEHEQANAPSTDHEGYGS